MRILHVIDSLSRGGAERQLLLLHAALLEAGHESVVGYLGPPDPLLDDHRSLPEVHDLGAAAGKSALPRAAAAVARRVRAVQPDVVHSSLMYSDLAVALGRGRGPSVSTLCNVVDLSVRLAADPTVRPWRTQLANRAWGAALRTRFRRVIAISAAVEASGRRSLRVPADRFVVVPRASTVDAASAVSERRAAGPPSIISVGRLVPQKGHDTLIRALADARLRSRPWRCEIVGDGPCRDALAALIRDLELEDRVRLVGQVPNAVERTARASLFVFPSQFEGLGVAAVEAATLGVPSIVSSVPALLEIVTSPQMGWRVPPNDAPRLADAIVEALDDPERARQKGEALRTWARSRFSPRSMLEATVGVYEQAIDPSATRA